MEVKRDHLRAKPRIATLTALTLMMLCVGCMQERVVDREFDFLRQAAAKDSDASTADPDAQDNNRRTWAIRVQRFTGSNRNERAEDTIRQLENNAQLSDLWKRDTGLATIVYHGRFADPRDENAQAALRNVRGLSLNGDRPFQGARFMRVGAEARGDQDPLNIAQHRDQFTLQVAFFHEAAVDDRRAAAEKAARKLRDAGHEAYYYHGKHQSLVTVGVFHEDEALVKKKDPLSPNAMVDAYAPKIRDLQKTFPYNLANPDAILEAQKEDRPDAQSSGLVRVI